MPRYEQYPPGQPLPEYDSCMPRPPKTTVKSKHGTAKNRASHKRPTQEGCIIPGPVPVGGLRESVLKHNDREAEGIREYVEWQCKRDRERVSHLEKLASHSA